jgi:NTE family protein
MDDRPPSTDRPAPAVDPLASPAIGTSSDDLIKRCLERGIPPLMPPPPELPPAIAVSLSGGGFRATLAGLGVLRLLADIGRLGSVRYLSSVSGGSIASGLFAVRYRQLRERNFTREALDDLVVRPFVESVSSRSFARALVWRIATRLALARRVRVLADTLDEWFYEGYRLDELDPRCRWIYNAANATTGVRFGFENNRIGDYVCGYLSTDAVDLRVADAVAASCAFPGAFNAMTLDGVQFPCHANHPPRLLDGGAYDNLGLESLDDISRPPPSGSLTDVPCLVVCNSGGVFRVGKYLRLPVVGGYLQTTSLLYRQTTALRTQSMVERYKLWEREIKTRRRPPSYARRGVLFGLASNVPDVSAEWHDFHPRPPDEERIRLSLIKTSLDRMNRGHECIPLIDRGWWLAGATLATYQAELLSPPYPGKAPL